MRRCGRRIRPESCVEEARERDRRQMENMTDEKRTKGAEANMVLIERVTSVEVERTEARAVSWSRHCLPSRATESWID